MGKRGNVERRLLQYFLVENLIKLPEIGRKSEISWKAIRKKYSLILKRKPANLN